VAEPPKKLRRFLKQNDFGTLAAVLDQVAQGLRKQKFRPAVSRVCPTHLWSLTNSFTSALKELDPVPQFKATATLGNFFASLN